MKRYTKQAVCEAYKKTVNFNETVSMTGCPPYVAYLWLKKEKLLSVSDGMKLGTLGGERGASAEREFMKLVPDAMYANGVIQGNCPSFDFDVYGILVDVKYSSLNADGLYLFRASKNKALQPDFYAVFCVDPGHKELSAGYRLFLIPAAFVTALSGRINLKTEGSQYWQYEVRPEKLASIFSELND